MNLSLLEIIDSELQTAPNVKSYILFSYLEMEFIMRSFRYTFISASVALSVISTGIFANPHIKVRTSVDKNESFSSVERVIDPDYNASISEWIVIMKQKPLLLTEDSGALRKVSGSLSGVSLNQRSKFKQQLQAYEDEIYAQQNSVLETAL